MPTPAMKTRAVIFQANRTNRVVVLNPKQIDGRVFKVGDSTYIIHPDRFMVTTGRPAKYLWFKQHYATFYYKQGVANPIPVPDFTPWLDAARRSTGKNGTGIPAHEIPEGITDEQRKKLVLVAFKDVVDNGVSGAELAAIFTPWFYRTIAAQTRSIWEQIQMFISVGILIALVYLIYALTTGHYHAPLEEIPPPGA